jgi:hypothetical protein
VCSKPCDFEALELWAQSRLFRGAEHADNGNWQLQENKSDGKTIIQRVYENNKNRVMGWALSWLVRTESRLTACTHPSLLLPVCDLPLPMPLPTYFICSVFQLGFLSVLLLPSQGIHKTMVRIQRLIKNLFLNPHGHNTHYQQRELSKFVMWNGMNFARTCSWEWRTMVSLSAKDVTNFRRQAAFSRWV